MESKGDYQEGKSSAGDGDGRSARKREHKGSDDKESDFLNRQEESKTPQKERGDSESSGGSDAEVSYLARRSVPLGAAEVNHPDKCLHVCMSDVQLDTRSIGLDLL